MIWGLVMISGFIPAALGSTNETAKGDSNSTDVQQALDNISGMERDVLRFYKQWDSLARRIAAQGNGRAMELCSRDYSTECTMEKRREITSCISTESKAIHDLVVEIYNRKVRKPWESEFERLKGILQHPELHSTETVSEAVWTVNVNNTSEESVRYRFYNSLVNFQSPPDLYPIDKVYQLCLNRLFKK